MPKRKVGYKEPASYFNADMRKAAEEWEKENKKKKSATPTKGQPKKK